jgi:hypothetical protein
MKSSQINQIKNPFVESEISKSEKTIDEFNYFEAVKQYKKNPETLLYLQSSNDKIYQIADTLLKDQGGAKYIYPVHCEGYGEEPALIKAVAELLEENRNGTTSKN